MGALMKSRKGSLVLVLPVGCPAHFARLRRFSETLQLKICRWFEEDPEDDPFLILTAQQLARVSSCLDAHFRLMADIDHEMWLLLFPGLGLKPIGSMDEGYTSSLDDNSLGLSGGLYINREGRRLHWPVRLRRRKLQPLAIIGWRK